MIEFADMRAGDTFTAWELIGYEGPLWLQVAGGRARYEAAVFNDNTHGYRVRLDRLVAGVDGLRVVNRYVDPDTRITLVEGNGT